MSNDFSCQTRDTLRHAREHLEQLGDIYVHPRRKLHSPLDPVATMQRWWTVGHIWHREFDKATSAFLNAAASVPDLLDTHLGWDRYLSTWLKGLDASEQKRRKEFHRRFEPERVKFKTHPLTAQRKKVQHRNGRSDWYVEIEGKRGTFYGDAVKQIPLVEPYTPLDGDPPNLPAMLHSHPWFLHIGPENFWWGKPGEPGRLPFFETAHKYLKLAEDITKVAAGLSKTIHDGQPLSAPP